MPMLMKTDIRYSFEEIIKDFLEFVQQGSTNVQAWEVIDMRYNSFYGATIRVPIKKYENNGDMPYFYISIQHTKITKHTYHNWLRNTHDMPYEKFAPYKKQDNRDNYIGRNNNLAESHLVNTYNVVGHNMKQNRLIYTKYGEPNEENPFKEEGEFIAIAPHTHYSKNLWMCEQGGVCCEKEVKSQTNKLNLVKAREVTTTYGYGDNPNIDLPIFPGSGCPWFTISEKDKTNYRVEKYGIKYWFTKDDYSATITLRLSNGGLTPDIYQSMHFGMMDNFDSDSYRFPLFVAGGTQGLQDEIWVYTAVYGGVPTYLTGNSYKLGVMNAAMASNNLLHPCKFNGSETSNFKVMAPDGQWLNIFNMTQDSIVKQFFSCGVIYDWSYMLGMPKFNTKDYDTIYPWSSDCRFTTDSYRIIAPNKEEKANGLLHDIYVNSKDNYGFYGRLPNAKWCWSKNIRAGEVELAGKKYLAVPNGWEGRKYFYEPYSGVVNGYESWRTDDLTMHDLEQMNKYGQNTFSDKLLIRLED